MGHLCELAFGADKGKRDGIESQTEQDGQSAVRREEYSEKVRGERGGHEIQWEKMGRVCREQKKLILYIRMQQRSPSCRPARQRCKDMYSLVGTTNKVE